MSDPVNSTALAKQEGGDHYKKLTIQPVEYIHANGIGYFEGNVIKYVTRWRDKGGVADLLKAKHYIELLVELEQAATKGFEVAAERIAELKMRKRITQIEAEILQQTLQEDEIEEAIRAAQNREGTP